MKQNRDRLIDRKQADSSEVEVGMGVGEGAGRSWKGGGIEQKTPKTHGHGQQW